MRTGEKRPLEQSAALWNRLAHGQRAAHLALDIQMDGALADPTELARWFA